MTQHACMHHSLTTERDLVPDAVHLPCTTHLHQLPLAALKVGDLDGAHLVQEAGKLPDVPHGRAKDVLLVLEKLEGALVGVWLPVTAVGGGTGEVGTEGEGGSDVSPSVV